MLKKTEKSRIYAVQFSPENYSLHLLKQLINLPNLEQIQLAGCAVEDSHLKELTELHMLTGIGMDNTSVTDACAEHLEQMVRLQHIEYEGTELSDGTVRQVLRGIF